MTSSVLRAPVQTRLGQFLRLARVPRHSETGERPQRFEGDSAGMLTQRTGRRPMRIRLLEAEDTRASFERIATSEKRQFEPA